MLLCLASFAAAAAHAGGSAWYLGQRYPLARSKLISHGYRPLRLKHRADLFCKGDDFCRRFPEALSCSAGGIYYWDFAFVRLADGKHAVVTTRGETQYKIISLKEPSKFEEWLIREHRK